MPKKIVVFRKGESEGQKDRIREDEVSGCWEAFQEIDENWEPSLFTYIMWNKHSGIRFSTMDFKNPAPGTLIHGSVTSKWQFSLQSHQTSLAAINAPLYTIINAPQMLEKKKVRLAWTEPPRIPCCICSLHRTPEPLSQPARAPAPVSQMRYGLFGWREWLCCAFAPHQLARVRAAPTGEYHCG